jgi:hypothetical protein
MPLECSRKCQVELKLNGTHQLRVYADDGNLNRRRVFENSTLGNIWTESDAVMEE